jgi:hypothetical protein
LRYLSVLLVLLITSTALAQQSTRTSHWKSSSGANVKITSADTWVTIEVAHPGKQSSTWKGSWLRKYNLFEYQAAGQTFTAHMTNNGRIEVTSSKGVKTIWTQAGESTHQQANAGRVTGRWRSSSGNVFDVSTKGSKVWVTAYTTKGQTLKGSGTWQDTVSFTYQLQGFNQVATCTLLNDGRLQVSTPGNPVTYWSKQ